LSLIIAGTFRVPPEALEHFRPHMLEMTAASRAEDGCEAYAYAEAVEERGLIRVFEIWRDQAAVDAHVASGHMARRRASWPAFGVSDRRLKAYEIAGQHDI
jgi:quinol monooxygenase YgiN